MGAWATPNDRLVVGGWLGVWPWLTRHGCNASVAKKGEGGMVREREREKWWWQKKERGKG